MNNALIVFFDAVIIVNLLAVALLLFSDLARTWRTVVAFLILISSAALAILTLGDIVIWVDSLSGKPWFMERHWRAGWRGPLSLTLTAINIAIVSIHRGNRT